MKLNKIIYKDYKFLCFSLLNSQKALRKNPYSAGVSFQLLYLKKLLKLIYSYHIHNYKIVFLGFPPVKKSMLKKLLYNTQHNFILKQSKTNTERKINPNLFLVLNNKATQKKKIEQIPKPTFFFENPEKINTTKATKKDNSFLIRYNKTIWNLLLDRKSVV